MEMQWKDGLLLGTLYRQPLKATKDLCERALEEIAYLEQREQRKGTKREIQKIEQER